MTQVGGVRCGGGRRCMAVATLLEFTGVTQAQYKRVGAQLELTGGPDGVLYHACGAVDERRCRPDDRYVPRMIRSD